MSEEFGSQPIRVVHASGLRSPAADMEMVRERLADLARGGPAELNIAQPQPTAAFSRRDALLPGYEEAGRVVLNHGFSPIIRPVGGHLAVYGSGSLVVHLWAAHREPRAHIRGRFQLLGAAMANGLRALGVDARVGPVPGEYCDGEFSVNDSGRTKLVGTGQRITRAGYLFSAVVMVQDAEPVREALTDAYGTLGLAFRPETVGCVADSVRGITVDEVRENVVAAFSSALPLLHVGAVGRLPTPPEKVEALRVSGTTTTAML